MGIEEEWLRETLSLNSGSFDAAVDVLRRARGKIVVCGMGKSGIVARKIAATLTSTGSPAYFLHPAEGIHGDIGILARGDAALVLSKSGETPEIAAMLPALGRLEIPVVSITSRRESMLSRASGVVLLLPDREEACPYNLAPTASTTAMMALGDALAMALLRLNGFSPGDFAHVHPGGILGRKLLLRVADLMTPGPLPLAPESAPLTEAVEIMTRHRGVCIAVDDLGRLSGIFVYGDLGRLMKNRADILNLKLSEVLVRNPATVSPLDLASVAVAAMEKKGITSVVAVDPGGSPLGILYLHDALREGVR
jgi:arabinose-5-phosphate isomerase